MSVEVSRDGGLVTLTLNRPERKNAIDLATWNALRDELLAIAASSDDRCVILQGAGEAFSSGADMAENWLPNPPVRGIELVQRTVALLYELPQPTIAKVRGHALGAGMCLAIACDLVVSDTTAHMAMPFVTWGLSPDCGGTWMLARLVGVQRAKQIALLGTRLDAAEAEALGLITRVVDVEDLDAAAEDWGQRLAAAPPTATQQTKQLISDAPSSTLGQALAAEARAQSICVRSPDHRDAITASQTKRAPKTAASA